MRFENNLKLERFSIAVAKKLRFCERERKIECSLRSHITHHREQSNRNDSSQKVKSDSRMCANNGIDKKMVILLFIVVNVAIVPFCLLSEVVSCLHLRMD